MAAFTCVQIFLMIGMLVTGSINTLSKKAQNDCIVKGYKSTEHSFDHPWFQTWIMFIGESLCLIGLCLHRRRELQEYRKHVTENDALMVQPHIEVGPPVHARVFQWIVVVPTCCDLVGTSLAGIGLVYVDASVWQMLRGSIIIFAGILSKIFLKRKLKLTHWLGMIMVMIGLVLVGCSSVFKSQDHKTAGSKTLLGILLILGSQIVSASQMVIEEAFLKKRNLHPLHVVGLEGSYGFVLMSFIVLPAMYFIPGDDVHNNYENSVDALYQIYYSPRLLVFCLLYLGSIAFYNYFGLAVTRSLTAVHRTLIDACRTIMVWGVDLIIYYAFDKNFGEPFDKTYGILQIDGFLFLMIGTAMYNQLIDLRNFVPCCTFQSEEMKNVYNESSHHGNIQDVSYSEEESDNENTKLLKGRR
ncbi:solute carrier family 35 member F6-like isoform X2 [Mercenaria mercenaria]|uniref:solute carrier family 35 member F6-like isoform X2 n=1 Tax=Mercenaria mercenaria TaxID=6596 RepID=UPI00234E3C9E|nr:solute carrier family 35 member F6-like isoform X2 [Mercenaria mercenaria]